MRPPAVSKTVILALAVCVSSLALVAVVPPAHASAVGVWQRPVPGDVARAFRAPLTRYGPGHLGADLVTEPGTPVRAAGRGTVVFAGVVAGTMHVVVAHPGGLRTSYSFLASIRVRSGQTVRRGEIVGTAGGRGAAHDGSVLHFGLRIGDIYLDPMRLFAAPDLAAVVHLAPFAGPSDPVARGAIRSAATGSARGAPFHPVEPAPPAGSERTVASGRRTPAGATEFPR